MLKNKLVGFAATTNLKLQNLDPVYTRLLNKNIDITQIKKVNSQKKNKSSIKQIKLIIKLLFIN